MEIKRITLKSLEQILDGGVDKEHLVVIKFYGEECYLCHGLAPIYRRLAKSYDDVIFYAFNMADGGEYVETKYGFQGTPSLCVAKTGENSFGYKFLSEPAQPDKESWYYENDIKKFIERYK